MTREQIQLIEAENVSYRKIFDRLNGLIEDFEDRKYRTPALMLDALKSQQEQWEILRSKYDLLLERETTRSGKHRFNRRPGPSRS
jgi:hypothetical protein